MSNLASIHAIVHGQVQGVFFRDFVRRQASSLGLTGIVRNLSDGSSVEVFAEGEPEKLRRLQEVLRVGPPRSRVEKIEATDGEYSGSYSGFKIKR